jgi:tetratricopeptide (TPR) repeat protein
MLSHGPMRATKAIPIACASLAFACSFLAGHLHAETPADSDLGWSSFWTQPQTPREKSASQFWERLAAAVKSQDFGPLLADCQHRCNEHPDDLFAVGALFSVHYAMKRYGDCLADLDRIASISTRNSAPPLRFANIDYSRSLIHRLERNYAAEAGDLERSLKEDDTSARVLNSLAWLRATNLDVSLRDGRAAVKLAQHAVGVAGDSSRYLDTLAAAYAERGDFEHAVSNEKEAIENIGRDARDPKEAARRTKGASDRLQLYLHDQPFRDNPNAPTSL